MVRPSPLVPLLFSILLLVPLLAVTLTGTASAQSCTKTWTAPVNGLWTDAANWTPTVVPSAADNVCIIVDGTYTVTLTGSSSVASVTVGAAGNNGVQTLLILGSSAGSHASLTSATGFTNSGDITLSSIDARRNTTLTVSSGTFINQGTINVEPGTTGARTISANLVNNGTVNLNANTTFSKSSGVYTNNGSINIATGRILFIFGSSQVFNQNSGDLAISGGFGFATATFNFNGGTITGTPVLTTSNLNIGPGATTAVSFTLRGANNFSGDINPGQSLLVLGSSAGSHASLTSATGFTNSGDITLSSIDARRNTTLTVSSGTFINQGTINVEPGTTGARTIVANLVNNGAVNLNANTTFSRSSGVYTNNASLSIATGKTLTISGASQVFNQNSGDLAVSGDFRFSSATFNFNGGTITGTPVLTSSNLNISPGATTSVNFTLRNSNNLSGDVNPGQSLLIQGSSAGSHASLTAATGFTNSGDITFSSIDAGRNTTLTVTSGTFVNQGTINVEPGTTGARTIVANLVNNGAVNLNADTTFVKSSGVYTNNASLNIASGKTLSISGISQVFNQNSGDLAVSGDFRFSSATFNFNGGTITGTPVLTSSNLNISPGATTSVNFTLRNSNNLSGDVNPGQSLLIQGSSAGSHASLTAATGFTNSGDITFSSIDAGRNTTLTVTSGTFVNQGTINVEPGTTGARTIVANLVNNGAVNLNANTTFSKSSGVYTNNASLSIATGKTLTISGASQVFNQNSGDLAVSGDFSSSTATFNFNGGIITGTPVLTSSNLNIGTGATTAVSFTLRGSNNLSGDVNPGQSLLVQGSSAGNHASLTAATGFTNSGDITFSSVDAARNTTLTVSSGTFINQGTINVEPGTTGARTIVANLVNNGTMNLNANTTFATSSGVYTNNGSLNIAVGRTLTISGSSQVFNQNGGDLAISGDFSFSTATFNFNGGAITGTPILTTSNLNISPGATTSVNFTLRNSNNLSGDVHPGQSLLIQGSSAGSHASLTAATGFTNSGDITFSSIDAGRNTTLTVTSGTFVNQGTINVEPGTTGARTIVANLVNNGTLNLNANTTFSKSSGVYTNNASLNIASGRALTISGSSQVFNQNSGDLAVSGDFRFSSATFNFNGGTVTGTPVLTSSNLNIATGATAAVSFTLRGPNTFSGDVHPGQSLLIQGSSAGSHASLTAATGFTNSGDITFSSIDAGRNTTLTVTSGTFVNQGTINVEPGTTGARTISAELDNGGTVNFRTAATLGRAGADHTNSGNFNINGATVTVTGNTLTNTPGGTISGTGTLNVSGVVFTNNGQVSPGLSPGILDLAGDYTQGAPGSVRIEIGGLTAGTGFDQLNITGNATLDGTLSVGLIGGFVPISGDSFRVLSFGSGAGGFAAINDEDPSDGVSFESILNATGVTLKVSVVAVSPIARTDLNGDGRIGPHDLRLVVEKFNTSDGTADVDRDGRVGVLDVALVGADYGKQF